MRNLSSQSRQFVRVSQFPQFTNCRPGVIGLMCLVLVAGWFVPKVALAATPLWQTPTAAQLVAAANRAVQSQQLAQTRWNAASAAATCPPATALITEAATSLAAAVDSDEPLDPEFEEELIAALAEELRRDRSEVEDSEDSDRNRTPIRSPPAAVYDALPPEIATQANSLDVDMSGDTSDVAELSFCDASSEDEDREAYLRELGVDEYRKRDIFNDLIEGIGLGDTAGSGSLTIANRWSDRKRFFMNLLMS